MHLLLLIALLVCLGLYRTRRMEQSSAQKEFHKGKVPDPLPDGLYKGSVAGYGGAWKGKLFARKTSSGINLFEDGKKQSKKYEFQMYASKGLRDSKQDVIRIDYDSPKNPFWVRMVLDEIVKVGKDKYLGKVHIRLIPGLPFTVGFFRLSK